ncbi:MAG: DUF4443 domain-containing protein [Nitrosopumilaceae archaeon]
MHQVLNTLSKVAQRYAPSRTLTFEIVHVFKTMQLLEENTRISRTLLIKELGLGEGSVKTLVKHLKMHGFIANSNAGMWLTNKGRVIFSKLQSSIPIEMSMQRCSITLGKFNHAILVKGLAKSIISGIEQRDAAIKIGAVGATTLIFQDGKFMMPDKKQDLLRRDKKLYSSMMEKLRPEDNDVIIIGSAEDKNTAEMAAKSAALQTVADHEKHF